MKPRPDLSVVAPIYNEAGNLAALHRELTAALTALGRTYELIFIDDGSRDGSQQVLRQLAAQDPFLKVLLLRRNSGQTAALQAGIDLAAGATILTIDADLQNDPADIGRLVAKLEEGYDLVSGWRRNRQDHALRRNLPSRLANRLVSHLSGVPLHDYGCALKAYRAEFLKPIRLYGEMHRFLPIFVHRQGARIAEIPVGHRPRQYGASHYGLNRVFKVLYDLYLLRYTEGYFQKPMYHFGDHALRFGGLALGALGIALMGLMIPLPEGLRSPWWGVAAVAGLGCWAALQLGLLADAAKRIYYESQNLPTYEVAERINCTD
jgi:glycosyltransferase involved in cell wall biosynthesis